VFLTESLVKFPTVFGFAIQHENELICESHPTSWKTEDILTLVKGSDTGHRILVMGNWPSFENVEDVPPFVIEDRQGQAIMAIGLEGDFSDYSDTSSKHTDEFNAWFDEVGPKIEKVYNDASEDFDKFVAGLNDQKFQKILSKTASHRGQFVILPRIGEPIMFGKNDLGKKFSWGYVSNAHGLNYAEKETEPTKTEELKELSFLDKMRAKVSPASSSPSPDVKPLAVSTKNVLALPPKTETKDVSHVGLVEMKCPAKLEKGVKNHWLRLFNAARPGQLPEDHLSKNASIWVHPDMVAFAKRDIAGTKDMRTLITDVREFTEKNSKTVKEKAPITTANNGGKSTVREPSSNYVNTSTVLDVKDKEKSVNHLAGFLDNKLPPMEIQKLEAKWPQFSDEVGVQFEELLFLSPDQIMKLFDGNKIATAAFIQVRRKFIETSGINLSDLVGSSKGEEPTEVNTEKVNDQPVKPAASVASTGGGLSFLRRAG